MADEGKFFFIRSQLNEMVLTVTDNIMTSGQPVTTLNSHGGPNQLWYEDKINNVIRSKGDDNMALDIVDDCLVIREYQSDEYWQHWRLAGDHLESIEEPDKCISIQEASEDEGAQMGSEGYDAAPHHMWNFENVPPVDFYIRSFIKGKRCLDVREADTEPGAKVILNDCGSIWEDHQTWYEDKYGYIHSRLNDMVMDTIDGSARMQELDSDVAARTWVRNGDKIVQRADPSRCLQLRDERCQGKNGNKIDEEEYTGGEVQRWVFDYKN